MEGGLIRSSFTCGFEKRKFFNSERPEDFVILLDVYFCGMRFSVPNRLGFFAVYQVPFITPSG